MSGRGELRPRFLVREVSPTYWWITFDNAPANLVDADTVEELAELLTALEESPRVAVAVFGSANADHFMSHWDPRESRARVLAMPPGATGLHLYADNLVRLSKLPLVTICAIRGRVSGAGGEFALATDIRLAGDHAVLGHLEAGIGAVPGGGAMARLARLIGRGRALEVLLGADDLCAERAAQYGYVNRVLPDAELHGAVHAFASRVAGFDKAAIGQIKALVDLASLPPDEELGPGFAAFAHAWGRPENAARVRGLLDRGRRHLSDAGPSERDADPAGTTGTD
jgi:enoyl-CoA hydratase/carnithine racemase